MGLGFRKTVKLFPGVRLNFNGGGISTTVGVRGASVNIGRRGTYLNVGLPGTGLSYRTKISAPPAQPDPTPAWPLRVSPAFPAGPDPGASSAPEALPGEIRSAAVSAMSTQGLGVLKQLINEATVLRGKLTTQVAESERHFHAAERKLKRAQSFLIRLFLQRSIPRLAAEAEDAGAALEQQRYELAACRINVDFAFDDAALNAFAALMRTYDDLCRSSAIWDIAASVATNQVAERTIASSTLTRIPVQFGLADSDIIDSKYQALHLANANGDDVYVYPGFVMMRSKGRDFALVDLRETQLEFRISNFIEEDGVPGDGEVIGQTWKKTNKDGSPDRRFVDNYQIPVVRYGQLWFCSSTGLHEAYMVSNCSKAETFAEAFAEYQNALTRLAEFSRRHRPIETHEFRESESDEATTPAEAPRTMITPAAPRWLVLDWIALAAIALVFAFVGYGVLHGTGARRGDAATQVVHPNETLAKSPSSPAMAPASPSPSPGAAPTPSAAQPARSVAAPPHARPPDTASRAPATVTPAARETAYVLRDRVNIRSEPSTSAAVVRTEVRGKRLVIFRREGEWAQVGENAPAGWVHVSLIGALPP